MKFLMKICYPVLEISHTHDRNRSGRTSFSSCHAMVLSVLRHSKSGKVNLTEMDSQGRTYAIYAIEKNSPACLKVIWYCDTVKRLRQHGAAMLDVPSTCLLQKHPHRWFGLGFHGGIYK